MSEAVINPPTFTVARPQASEYAPYYERYISLIQGEDILNTLDQQRREMMLLISCRDDEDGDFRYAPEKWSAKEVLGHVCDTERVFAYRALRISRADATPLEGFEQDDYVRNARSRSVRWLILWRTSSRCAGPRFRCCAIWMRRRGRAAGLPTKMKSACGRWLILSRGMSCTIGEFWKRSTLRRVADAGTLCPHAH